MMQPLMTPTSADKNRKLGSEKCYTARGVNF